MRAAQLLIDGVPVRPRRCPTCVGTVIFLTKTVCTECGSELLDVEEEAPERTYPLLDSNGRHIGMISLFTDELPHLMLNDTKVILGSYCVPPHRVLAFTVIPELVVPEEPYPKTLTDVKFEEVSLVFDDTYPILNVKEVEDDGS